MRVFVPREVATSGGGTAFSTSDELLYFRKADGTITRGQSKEQQKANRKAAKKLRRASA